MPSRGWVFTVNVPKDEKEPHIWLDDHRPSFSKRTMTYLVFVHQKVGNDHWQGYCQFKCEQRSGPAMKYLFGNKAEFNQPYLAPQRGTADEAKDYITKDEKETNQRDAEEFGEFDPTCVAALGQGTRSDLQTIVRQIINDKMTDSQCLLEWPDLYDKNHKMIAKAIAMGQAAKPVVESKLPAGLWEKIEKPLHDYLHDDNVRKVLWLWSSRGGTGKTAALKYIHNNLLSKGAAVFLSKGDDDRNLAFRYSCEPFIIIDIGRSASNKEVIPYMFLEQVLDGVVESGKYESSIKKLDQPAKVIVASNTQPDHFKLSEDRYVAVNLD